MEYISNDLSRFLLVDIDEVDQLPSFMFVQSVCKICDYHPVALMYQRTERGWHIVLEIKEKLKALEQVALQLILGDDPMRGALNLMRTRTLKHVDKFWKTRFNILYSGKEKNVSRSGVRTSSRRTRRILHRSNRNR